MEPGAGGDVEHPLRAALLEQLDEEVALAFVAGVPVDEFVPFLDELRDVFLLVVIRLPDFDGVVAEVLANGAFLCALCSDDGLRDRDPSGTCRADDARSIETPVRCGGPRIDL